MAKIYKILKIEEDVHKELIKMQALMQLQDGKKYTFSELVKIMIASQPKYDIKAKKIEVK